jgi:hypothetical protein
METAHHRRVFNGSRKAVTSFRSKRLINNPADIAFARESRGGRNQGAEINAKTQNPMALSIHRRLPDDAGKVSPVTIEFTTKSKAMYKMRANKRSFCDKYRDSVFCISSGMI